MKRQKLEIELQKVSEAYQRNFKLMLKYTGKPGHDNYVQKEKKLNQEEGRIMRELGTLAIDPCPMKTYIPCSTCTGYYKRRGKVLYKCQEYDEGAAKCQLKGTGEEEIMQSLIKAVFVDKQCRGRNLGGM